MRHRRPLVSSGGRLTAPPCGPYRALNPGANRAGTKLHLSAPLLHGAKHASTPNEHCDLGIRRGRVAFDLFCCPPHAPLLPGQAILGALLSVSLEVRMSVRGAERGGLSPAAASWPLPRGLSRGPRVAPGVLIWPRHGTRPVWPILKPLYALYGLLSRDRRRPPYLAGGQAQTGAAPGLLQRPREPLRTSPVASEIDFAARLFPTRQAGRLRCHSSSTGTTPLPPCIRGGFMSYIGADRLRGRPVCVRGSCTLDN
jgi:hypothetical protein